MCKLCLHVSAHGHADDVHFSIRLNNKVSHHFPADDSKRQIELDIVDSPGLHQLILELKGKSHSHTLVDSTGKIVNDISFEITDIVLDDVSIEQQFWPNTRYLHNHNGSSEMMVDNCWGYMGYNGQVILDFETPMPLWLMKAI